MSTQLSKNTLDTSVKQHQLKTRGNLERIVSSSHEILKTKSSVHRVILVRLIFAYNSQTSLIGRMDFLLVSDGMQRGIRELRDTRVTLNIAGSVDARGSVQEETYCDVAVRLAAAVTRLANEESRTVSSVKEKGLEMDT